MEQLAALKKAPDMRTLVDLATISMVATFHNASYFVPDLTKIPPTTARSIVEPYMQLNNQDRPACAAVSGSGPSVGAHCTAQSTNAGATNTCQAGGDSKEPPAVDPNNAPSDPTLCRDSNADQAACEQVRRIGDVLYILVLALPEGCAAKTRAELDALLHDNAGAPRGVIIDLRHSSGYRLDEAAAFGSLFLPKDALIASFQSRAQQPPIIADGTRIIPDLPIVILVDQATSEASVTLAAALQMNKPAVVIGTATSGSGAIVSEYAVAPLGTLHLETAEVLSPTGIMLGHVGVAPDITLAKSGSELTSFAIKYLGNLAQSVPETTVQPR